MARSRLFVAVLVLLSLMLVSNLILSISVTRSNASDPTTSTGYSVSNFEQFNAYGQFSVNETLNELSNATQGVSSITYGFPAAFAGHIVAQSAFVTSGPTRTDASISQSSGANRTVMLTVSLSTPLNAQTNASVHLGFYVVDSFKPLNGSNYNASILFFPSVNMKIDSMASEIFMPSNSYDNQEPGLTTLFQSKGFSQTVNGSAVLYDATVTNSSFTSPSFATGNVYIDPTVGGALDFSNVDRQLSIGSDGSVTVKDSLTIKNLGQNTISTLNYYPLTNSSQVTLLPSSEPPLSNVGSANVSSSQLNLSGFNDNIEPNSAVTIVVQYSLSPSYLSYSNGEYSVKLPPAAPLGGIVDIYRVSVKAPSGIVVSGAPSSIVAVNSTSLPSLFTFTFKIGIGSAYGSAIPVAVLVFVAVFLGVAIFRPRTETTEDIVTTYDSLIKAVEDKVTTTNDILGELKATGTDVTRNDLVSARSRIDDLRAKSSSRMGVLRSQVTAPSVTVQSALNQVAASDREFDRAVRDLLNVYDQFISRKMREDTYRRVLQNNERRMQSATNSYLDSVHDMREDYEAEA